MAVFYDHLEYSLNQKGETVLPIESLYISVPLFLITAWLMRKSLYGIFDPLLINIFALCSSIGLMFAYYNQQSFSGIGILIIFLLCHTVFIIGFSLGGRSKFKLVWTSPIIRPSYLKISLFIVLLLLVLITFIMAGTVGLGIFQDNPEIAKTTLTGGAGIFKRMLPALTLIAGALLLVIKTDQRIGPISTVAIICIIGFAAISTGARSAFFVFFCLFVLRGVFLRRNYKIKMNLSQRRTLYALSLAVLFVALIIISIGLSSRLGISGGDLLSASIDRLVERIIAFGDPALFYFGLDVHNSLHKTPFDFIQMLASLFLGPLRIVEYIQPLGAEMYAIGLNVPNESNYGPNAQLYFAAVIYFGSIFGIIYSFVVGWFLAVIRRLLERTFKYSNLDMLLFIIIGTLIINISQDLVFTIGSILDLTATAILVFGLAAIGHVIAYRKPLTIIRPHIG